MALRRLRGGAVLISTAAVFFLTNPAAAQKLGQGGDEGLSMGRVVLALCFCLFLALAAAFVLRHKMNGGGAIVLKPEARRLQIIERVRLNQQVTICLVRCNTKEYLIAATSAGAWRIDVLESEGAAGHQPIVGDAA